MLWTRRYHIQLCFSDAPIPGSSWARRNTATPELDSEYRFAYGRRHERTDEQLQAQSAEAVSVPIANI